MPKRARVHEHDDLQDLSSSHVAVAITAVAVATDTDVPAWKKEEEKEQKDRKVEKRQKDQKAQKRSIQEPAFSLVDGGNASVVRSERIGHGGGKGKEKGKGKSKSESKGERKEERKGERKSEEESDDREHGKNEGESNDGGTLKSGEQRTNGGEPESKDFNTKERETKGRERNTKRKGSGKEKKKQSLDGATNEAMPAPSNEIKITRKVARKAEMIRHKAQRKSEKKKSSQALLPAPLEAETQQSTSSNGEHASVQESTESTSATEPYHEDALLSAIPQAEIDAFLTKNGITIIDPRGPSTLRPITSFSQLPRHDFMPLSTFSKFQQPTPIQSAAWPFLLSGRDVVGVAETGSGKTLAFGVPCIAHLQSLPSRKTSRTSPAQAVIVSPTRELAVQIHEQIAALAQPAGIATACVYGGVPKPPQREALRSARIVVATPGRLNDFIADGAADLSHVAFVVLDEADRMLDKGFEDDVRRIITATGTATASAAIAASRQTLMFTATWPPSIGSLAATFMLDPIRISIGDNATGELRANLRIEQRIEVIQPRDKQTRLLEIIRHHHDRAGPAAALTDRILVFCLYKKEAVRIEVYLRRKGLRVAAIHGDLSQEKRTASLDAFKEEGRCPLLVATDVAARGLDIPAVKMVINVTFPLTVEDYVHRIGRTGRAGATGLAITLFTEHDKAQSGPLINVLRAAGQPVPAALLKFGTTVKKKAHDAYGAFYKDTGDAPAAKRIRFDE